MFCSVDVAVEAFGRGEFLVLVDDAERENEGDLVVAAQFLTPEKVNVLDRQAGGMFLLATTEEHLERLGIPMIQPRNAGPDTPRFGVSFDAGSGIHTGMSVADRAKTVSLAIEPDTGAGDIVIPGHVLPLAARPQGLRQRRGHTEGAVELARMAGLFPAAVMSEVMTEDGQMARGEELVQAARSLGCGIVAIEDIAARVLG
jgi:3,4-dihydroxy 2-butanone 4-phosphate synthase / GTP cyclohydrolase II